MTPGPRTPSGDHLKRVQSVTDAALAHLTLERLLDELLLRVRELIGADTAAVLLLDEQRQELIATAAKGIEEEVEQGVRLPVGRGFAGRIAASGQPVILESVDHTKVLNPLLLRRGIRSMLGVPLIVGGSVIGVLHVGTLKPRVFTEDDVGLLQLVADRAALALHVRGHEQDRLTAETLQRSLLPDRFPRAQGVEIAGLYAPAGGGMVGGDWYDVFALPSGALCVVVGDTVGSGLRAAIAMSRLRDAVRTLSYVNGEPAHIMTRLNEMMMHFEPGLMATAFIGVVGVDGTMTYTNAGHVPPVVVDESSDATIVETAPQPSLGAAVYSYRQEQIAIAPGSRLILYTDGLVERRGRPLEEGLEALRAAAEQTWTSVEELCGRVVGGEGFRAGLADDVAVVTLRFASSKPGSEIRTVVPADPRELAPLRHALRRWCTENGISRDDVADVLLALGEAVANAIEHAYGPGRGAVEVGVAIRDRELHATVKDEGRWREPRGTERGRGRTLIAAAMDEVAVEADAAGTTIRMRKVLTDAG